MHSLLRIAVSILLATVCSSEVIALNDGNLEQILKNNDMVFVNFYADWCRFSQQLKPIFEQASENFKNHAPGKIVWASVDADRQPVIATKYHVNKYPTLKLFRNGELTKKEYRSQRSVDALTAYINKQLESGLVIGTASEITEKVKSEKDDKRVVTGYFPANEENALTNFKKIANILREECAFYLTTDPAFAPQSANSAKVSFRDSPGSDVSFTGDFNNYEFLKAWITDKCIPLIREITFENAEELTEEGLPFLILFKHPDDKESTQIFTDAVIRELQDKKSVVNALVADGQKFAHPLHHLGKSVSDLPVIAIDSFRHMYLFPYKAHEVTAPGRLRQFVEDLQSGKLHREFHHGPDPTQPQLFGDQAQPSSPPESVFEKLKPSDNRYSILTKTEL